jgi:hypothetical protein
VVTNKALQVQVVEQQKLQMVPELVTEILVDMDRPEFPVVAAAVQVPLAVMVQRILVETAETVQIFFLPG